MLCYLIFHRWKQYNHLESRCSICGKFKIFYGYAETGVYKHSIIKDAKSAGVDTLPRGNAK